MGPGDAGTDRSLCNVLCRERNLMIFCLVVAHSIIIYFIDHFCNGNLLVGKNRARACAHSQAASIGQAARCATKLANIFAFNCEQQVIDGRAQKNHPSTLMALRARHYGNGKSGFCRRLASTKGIKMKSHHPYVYDRDMRCRLECTSRRRIETRGSSNLPMIVFMAVMIIIIMLMIMMMVTPRGW